MRVALKCVGVGAFALSLLAGCSRPEDLAQIQALQEEKAALVTENDDLLMRLNSCLDSLDGSRSSNAALQSQLDDCLRGARPMQPIQTTPAPTVTGAFTDYGTFAKASVGSDVLFRPGKAALSNSGKNTLAQIVAEIRSNYATREIWVVGHTDADPIKHSSWKDNLDLSLNRAATVFRELQKLGLATDRLIAAGQGEYNPIADNSSSDGKARNRRVEILAVETPD